MPDNCEHCPVSVRVDGLVKEFDRYREDSRTIHDGMDKRIRVLESETAVQGNKLDTIDNKLDDIGENQKSILTMVEEVKSKPGKRWEGLVTGLISSVGTAFLMWLMMGMPGA